MKILEYCLMMLKYLLQDFHLSLFQINGGLTRETRLKVAVNMENLTCLLETVRTLSQDLSLELP